MIDLRPFWQKKTNVGAILVALGGAVSMVGKVAGSPVAVAVGEGIALLGGSLLGYGVSDRVRRYGEAPAPRGEAPKE